MQPITLCPHMYACAHSRRYINAVALMWSMLATHPHRASRAIVRPVLCSHSLGCSVSERSLASELLSVNPSLGLVLWTLLIQLGHVLFSFFADKFHVLHLRAAAQIYRSVVFKVTHAVSTVTLCRVKWVPFQYINFICATSKRGTLLGK